MIFKMNRENIKRANELVKEVKELEALIPYIDNCLSQGIDGFNDSKFNEIKIVLTPSIWEMRFLNFQRHCCYQRLWILWMRFMQI